jgi:hypothetical protein
MPVRKNNAALGHCRTFHTLVSAFSVASRYAHTHRLETARPIKLSRTDDSWSRAGSDPGLSDYPDEQEVLLRGPFFQLVRLRENGARYGRQQIPVIEVLMLNNSRDHVSSVFLDDSEADSARKLFQALVQIERATLCAELAEEYRLSADAKAYKSICVQEQASVDKLLP